MGQFKQCQPASRFEKQYGLYQVRHLLLQLQHEHPVLAVLVQRVDDELGQVGARAVGVNFT